MFFLFWASVVLLHNFLVHNSFNFYHLTTSFVCRLENNRKWQPMNDDEYDMSTTLPPFLLFYHRSFSILAEEPLWDGSGAAI